jgi:S1-C subfamily serine protease
MARLLVEASCQTVMPKRAEGRFPAIALNLHGGQTPRMARIVRFLALIAALCGLVAVGLPSRLDAEPTDIAAAARGVVRVVLVASDGEQLSLIGHGSGVAIGPNRILTNAHVVAPTRDDETMRIGVVPSEGKGGWFARIIAFSPGNDLALLELTEAGNLPAVTLYTGPVADGQDVYAVGYPGNVDLAQGLNIGDIVSPSAPVKTHGNLSAGRSSKAFDTLLHTAPIGAGNSGGALLDACGRLIGINSFGTISQDADSEFYFAASMREVSRFLLAAKVKPQATGAPCRSLADFSRDEAARTASEKERAFEAAQASALATDKARREAQLAVISERENGMGLAGLALLIALATGGAALFLLQKTRKRDATIAGVLTVALLGGAVAAWLTRPSLAEIETRTDATVAATSKGAKPGAATTALTGDLVCVLDLERSRVTVSPTTDLTMNWRGDGCADGRDQFAREADGWVRVAVPDKDDTVTVARFDPATGGYEAERYLLDQAAMGALRAERGKQPPAQCGAATDAARALSSGQLALKALLPAAPNERLIYGCGKARAAP